MASTKISQLPALSTMSDTAIIPVVVSGATKTITGLVLKAYPVTTAANLAGGASGSIPYQTAAGATGFVSIGAVNTVLTSDGSTATWASLSGITAGASTNADNIQVSSLTAGDRYFALADSVNGSYVGLESTTVNKFNVDSGFTIGSTATFTMSTAATSTATGALRVTGGVGIGGNLYVGGEIVAQKLTIEYTTVTTTLVKTDDVIQTTNVTAASSTTTGALQIAGGAGVGGALYVGGGIVGTLANSTVDGTNGVGYLNIPQNSQSTAYTTVLGDAGKHIFHPAADANARTYTIAANASVAYPIGTVIAFVNMTSQAVTIAINSDTMYLGNLGTTGSRTLGQYGVANALKIASTTWIITGTALT